MTDTVRCRVYRSNRKAETYLYLREDETEEVLPEDLRRLFGRLELAMELELHAGRSLARENVHEVMNNLRTRGWHLQMPPPVEMFGIPRA
ncbi:YcgL domain-containing protein TevJSym_at00520 [Gammaproteobacteria bacterium]